MHPHRVHVALAGTGLLAVGLLLGGCGDEQTPNRASASQTPSPSASDLPASTPSPTVSEPSASPSTTPVGLTTPVWFTVNTRAGLRLAREQVRVRGLEPGREAVEAMIVGPKDPDYATTWDPETKVLDVTRSGDIIEVDLSREVREANVTDEQAQLMVQQLVYTVTDAMDPEAAVQLLVEGKPAGPLWGALSWDQPVRRQDPLAVRSLVQIDSVQEGDQVTSPVKVRGEAAVFEGTVRWRVKDTSGRRVAAGFTTTREGQTFSPYAFRVRLPAGSYVVEVFEDDASGGEGGAPMSDSRSFTVA